MKRWRAGILTVAVVIVFLATTTTSFAHCWRVKGSRALLRRPVGMWRFTARECGCRTVCGDEATGVGAPAGVSKQEPTLAPPQAASFDDSRLLGSGLTGVGATGGRQVIEIRVEADLVVVAGQPCEQ